MKQMHIYVRNIFRIALGAVVLPFMTACSDDDPVIDDTPDEEKEDTAPMVDVLADKLVTTFCEVDSAGPLEILTPRWGTVLDGAGSTELSCTMKDEADAFDFFCHTLADSELGKGYLSGTESLMTYDLGYHGKVTYSRGGGAGELARISFDMPRLKSTVTTLHILTPEAWPDNGSYSPYGTGQILCETVNGKQYYWLVVREYDSSPGIMMTVDYGWETTSRSDHYKSYTSYKKCAGKDAWDALATWWFEDPVDFKNVLASIQKIEKKRGHRLGYVTDLFTRTVSIENGVENQYQYGDTWDNKYYWWAKVRHVWESRSYYVILGKPESTYSTKFKSGNIYFKRNWSPSVPQHRNSNARYFTSNRNHELDRYTIVEFEEDE